MLPLPYQNGSGQVSAARTKSAILTRGQVRTLAGLVWPVLWGDRQGRPAELTDAVLVFDCPHVRGRTADHWAGQQRRTPLGDVRPRGRRTSLRAHHRRCVSSDPDGRASQGTSAYRTRDTMVRSDWPGGSFFRTSHVVNDVGIRASSRQWTPNTPSSIGLDQSGPTSLITQLETPTEIAIQRGQEISVCGVRWPAFNFASFAHTAPDQTALSTVLSGRYLGVQEVPV